jgi:hypothetical protein
MKIKCSFEINKDAIIYIPEKSHYNHCYYHIDVARHGDLILPEKCDTLYEEAEDDTYATYYSLGWFEGEEFVAAWTWLEDHYFEI